MPLSHHATPSAPARRYAAPLLLAAGIGLHGGAAAQCSGADWLALDPGPDRRFGYDVAIDGVTRVIGAHDPLPNDRTGAAYVFAPIGSAQGAWKLEPADGTGGEEFGTSVAVEGDRIVVGAPDDFTDYGLAGSAYVFERVGDVWVEVQRLLPSDPGAGDRFGFAVAVSGDRILVGAPRQDSGYADTGSAYVFEHDPGSGTWVETARLVGSTLDDDFSGFDLFGVAVDLEGDRALIGAPRRYDGAVQSGSAYVFELDAGVWVERVELFPSPPPPAGFAGRAVALSGDVAVFTSVGDDTAGLGTGAAFVMEFDGASWSQTAILTPPDAEPDQTFGFDVAADADRVLVGSRESSLTTPSSGSAYVFERERDGGAWSARATLVPDDPVTTRFFGQAVALSGDELLVGASGSPASGSLFAGAAHSFSLDACAFTRVLQCLGSGCPCGNDDAEGGGCRNSTGRGARLTATGSASLSADDLRLVATRCPPGNSGIFFATTTRGAPLALGDGLSCAGAVSHRFTPGVVDANGTLSLENVAASAPLGFMSPGDERHFQAWTRDVLCGPPPAPCPSPCLQASNLTAGLAVTFEP